MIYELKDLTQFLSTINTKDIIKSKDKIYYNLAMSFDIETSSFYEDKNGVIYTNDDYRKLKNTVKAEKKAIMYIWQFAIEENVIIGRTWNDFLYFCKKLYDFLNLKERYIVVYVHNLSYEFQFICKWFNWIDIFADSERKPIKATTDTHFIFKCSYRLSGYSLEVLANNLKSHNIKKMVGDLDYNLIRNSKTPISKEWYDGKWSDGLEYLSHISYILFTSQYAVKGFMRVIEYTYYQTYPNKDLKVISIGKTTTEALHKAGFKDVIQVDEDNRYGVIEWFKKERPKFLEQHPIEIEYGEEIPAVLYPCSSLSPDDIPEALFALRYNVTKWTVYNNELPKNPRRVNLNHFKRIVFTSPSTIDNFIKLYGKLPENTEFITRGPITQAHLEEVLNK